MKLALILLSLSLAVSSRAAETNTTPGAAEAKYTVTIEARTAEILKVLGLADTNQASTVHDIIIAQYRALNAWHNDNDAKLKAAKSDPNAVAQIRDSLKSLHNDFVAKLSAKLTPEQVEAIKDKMTYGKVQFTMKGYLAQYPNLSEENQREVLNLLKEAREEAMDSGSAQEKTAIFQRYKGKINNYLSKAGVVPEKKKPEKTSAASNTPASQ